MSDAANAGNLKTRRLVVRAVLIALYIGLTALVFVNGKGHTILIDNKDSDDGVYKAFEDVRVGIDAQEDSPYSAGDRGMAVVQGQRHRIVIDKGDGSPKIERTVQLPVNVDSVLVSLPKLVADAQPYMQPFATAAASSAPDDSEQSAVSSGAAGGTGTAGSAAAGSTENTGSGAASSNADADGSDDALFYSQPGGQGSATDAEGNSVDQSADSSDGGDAVFYSQPGGEGEATP